ncbi:glycosyltransferase family 39 protein [Candidatus Curtissbacteria bacterium]|nr:glycosyltransferase family 39 protein [Candidatus Curtissbacteria bacterium]
MKKYLPGIFLAISFLLTRLVNLKIIPIFTDEAIYTYWAQVALHDPANRFISLEDGKQPLFIWLVAIVQGFVSDPLTATRLVSIISGAGSLIGLYILTKMVINKRAAYIACLVYIFLPFTLLYDRMGLYDSLLTTTVIFSVYFSIHLAKKPRFKTAILTGVSLGLGLITKSSALIYMLLLPMPFILLTSPKKYLKNVVRWGFFAAGAAFLSQVIYNGLRLSPLFYMINRKNLTFIRPFSDFVKEPFLFFIPNVRSITNWQISYLGYPLFFFTVIALAYGLYKKNKNMVLLASYIAVPFLVEAFFNNVLYPRFVLFYFPFAIIIIAYGLDKLKSRAKNVFLFAAAVTVLFAYPITNSYYLLTDPPKATIADSDKNQYIQEWPAGFGVKEIVETLKTESAKSDVYVATEGTFGLLPYALKIYFYNQNNPQIIGYWPLNSDKLPEQIIETAKTKKTYVVFNENQKEINNPKLELISKYQKGSGNTYMRLYKVHE